MPDSLDLKEKWGALPVWAWGAIAGVVALVAYFVWARFSGKSSDGATPATSGTNIDAMGYQTAGIKGGSAMPDNSPVSDNNTSWLSRAATSVANAMSASPSAVYGALYKYITGQDITTTEKGYVDKAISLNMNPPEGVQGISTVLPDTVNTPTPPTTTTPSPKNLVGYIRASDGEISQLYSDNSITQLTAAAYARLGKPAYTQTPDSVYNSYTRNPVAYS